MGLLFIGFLLLVLLSVTASFFLIGAHRQDAQVINLAGRQRMLLQQIVRLALEFQQDEQPEHLIDLREAQAAFDRALLALESYGRAGYAGSLERQDDDILNTGRMEPGGLEYSLSLDQQILLQLERVKAGWTDFKIDLERMIELDLSTAELADTVASLSTKSDVLIAEADQLVKLYEASSTTKVERLRLVQLAFLAGAVLVLGIGGTLAHSSMVRPLKKLSISAERIGSGDLETPIRVTGPKEIRLLGIVLEKMRADLNHSHQELLLWASNLEKQVKERTQELEALFSVSRDITSRLELSDVLQSVTTQACKLLEGDAAFLCLLDQDGNSLKLHAHSGDSNAIWKDISPVCTTPASQVLSGDRALYCGRNGCSDSCQIISPEYRASHLVAPLRLGNHNSGALCVSSKKQDTLSSDSCGQLNKLAHVAVIALENARLYQQAERTAMLEERQRIAAEMHDGLAQSISTIQMAVDLAKMQIEREKVDQALEILSQSRLVTDQAIDEVRKAISSLQEEYPLSITLQDLLAGLVDEFSSLGCQIRLENCAPVPLVLPHQESEQILRIAREALINARRHSNTGQVTLYLKVQGGEGMVSVVDNGQGFDAEKHLEVNQNERHFGLKIMKARAGRIGGRLKILSSVGKGTSVTLTWPLSCQRKEGDKKNGTNPRISC
jgi:two-component system, NarL family, nitrate/nitrite sensor histidine kinase NarX